MSHPLYMRIFYSVGGVSIAHFAHQLPSCLVGVTTTTLAYPPARLYLPLFLIRAIIPSAAKYIALVRYSHILPESYAHDLRPDPPNLMIFVIGNEENFSSCRIANSPLAVASPPPPTSPFISRKRFLTDFACCRFLLLPQVSLLRKTNSFQPLPLLAVVCKTNRMESKKFFPRFNSPPLFSGHFPLKNFHRLDPSPPF